MKRIFLSIVTLLLTASVAVAQRYDREALGHDSLYVYLSWESMWDGVADTVVLDPGATVFTPYDIEFQTDNKETTNLIKKQAVAVALGDTVWMVNSKWFKDNNFAGAKRLRNYVPLYFSSKVAFIHWAGVSIPSFFYRDVNLEEFMEDANLYVIAFDAKQLVLLDHEQLSFMLGDYPDLKIRYESMADYKESYMIANYFLQYIDRLNSDPNVLPLF